MTIIKCCSNCGSPNVTHDALARWNPATQDWEISSLLDNADCDDCGGETSLIDRRAADVELEAEAAARKAGLQLGNVATWRELCLAQGISIGEA